MKERDQKSTSAFKQEAEGWTASGLQSAEWRQEDEQVRQELMTLKQPVSHRVGWTCFIHPKDLSEGEGEGEGDWRVTNVRQRPHSGD